MIETHTQIWRLGYAGKQLRSLAEEWAGTATRAGRLTAAVLGKLADADHDLIRTRTAEGRSRAMARRQLTGRLLEVKELAESYSVGMATISRLSE